jgi:RNA polymerase sigma factor (sigma-70 family)
MRCPGSRSRVKKFSSERKTSRGEWFNTEASRQRRPPHPPQELPIETPTPFTQIADTADTADAAHDALLVEIAALARQFAQSAVNRDPDDVAHDVVLACLVKMRAGEWTADRASLPGLVRRMVHGKAVDSRRSEGRRTEREAEHGRTLSESPPAWMSPELAMEAQELTELHQQALATIPEVCRRAYVMVREEGATYEEAAARLGVSRDAVASHVVRAQRRLRRHFAEHGIHAPARYKSNVGREAGAGPPEAPHE